MSPFLRKVRTASGATAVQIVEKKHGQRRIVEHLGSAHTAAELAALMHAGRVKLAANQPELDFDPGNRWPSTRRCRGGGGDSIAAAGRGDPRFLGPARVRGRGR